jgi:hypothetical protein
LRAFCRGSGQNQKQHHGEIVALGIASVGGRVVCALLERDFADGKESVDDHAARRKSKANARRKTANYVIDGSYEIFSRGRTT